MFRLNGIQKARFTLRLYFAVACLSVFTVAQSSLYPCPAWLRTRDLAGQEEKSRVKKSKRSDLVVRVESSK